MDHEKIKKAMSKLTLNDMIALNTAALTVLERLPHGGDYYQKLRQAWLATQDILRAADV